MPESRPASEWSPAIPPAASSDPAAWEADSASPSLGSTQTAGSPAYELKFVLDENLAALLERHFSGWLTLDPHADPKLDHCYQITSLYTDTPRFDVFHREPGHRRSKYRVRSYGDSNRVYFEKKTKSGQRVRKTRVAVEAAELRWLAECGADGEWSGNGYRTELLRRSLRPVCQISYLRRAYFACTAEGRLRLTFDRELQGAAASHWTFAAGASPSRFGEGRVICEFKFQKALPSAFKRAIEEFRLEPTGFSKYRTFLESAGLAAPRGESACA
ncbi:MAG: polyphosphate polymerase domain-containing protein [Planctomyces sp.]|nr:polyphosphate polymerase domain-containing protein [Planctomyces sp.]